MRVLSIVVLLAVAVHSATIYDALQASKQFTTILSLVDKVPQLRNILSDPNVRVTFFAPSDAAIENTPYRKPFRYLFTDIIDVSNMKAGSRFNYRGEKIMFRNDKSKFNFRTDYISLPDTASKYQSRILRAPLRKENGLLENGNLYYINRLVYSCGELTRAQCEATADDQCKGKCNLKYNRVAGTNVINTYPDLATDFKPDTNMETPVVKNTMNDAGEAISYTEADSYYAPEDAVKEEETAEEEEEASAPASAPGPAPAAAPVEEDNTYKNTDGLFDTTEAEKGYGAPDEDGYGLGYYGR